ncbi:hypothetical protein BVG80_11395 [Sphingobacteriales bacterium TSM_CSM]|nr:hypothetical protein BVG80_11395 [Sphingobacteriales bacterium TSM_CSM]
MLLVFLTKFLSFYRKERKVLRKVIFALYGQCFQSASNRINCQDLQIVPELLMWFYLRRYPAQYNRVVTLLQAVIHKTGVQGNGGNSVPI